MGKKYIIELEDKPFHKGDGDFLYRVKGFNSLVFDMTGVGKLSPYTAPDLDKVKADAYNNGYKAGREAEKLRQPDMEQVRKEAYENGYENGFVAGHLKAEKDCPYYSGNSQCIADLMRDALKWLEVSEKSKGV